MYSCLRSLVPSFNECADGFLEKLRVKAAEGGEILLRKEIGAVTLQIIGKVCMLIAIVAIQCRSVVSWARVRLTLHCPFCVHMPPLIFLPSTLTTMTCIDICLVSTTCCDATIAQHKRNTNIQELRILPNTIINGSQ